MNAEKQARLQVAIETAKTNLADLKTQRDAAQAELTNLRAGRGELIERRNAAAKLSVSATEKKTALARQEVKGTRTAEEIAGDNAAAVSDLEAAEAELETTRTLLTALDDEMDAQQAVITESTAAVPAAESALWAAVERVETAAIVDELKAPLTRLQAVLKKSRESYSRQDLLAVVTRALDTAGALRDQATAALEGEYLG